MGWLRMTDFGKKEATIYVKQDEHANIHSLPFRYGFYFKANQKLEIFECKDWLNETNKEGQKTIKVTANFRDDKGKTWNALFTLMDNKAQYYKLVTLWDPADRATEKYLSDKIRDLCDEKTLSTDELVILHPYYLSGEATTVNGLIASIRKALPGKEVDPKVIKDEVRQEVSEQAKNIKNEINAEIGEVIKSEISKAVKDEISILTPELLAIVQQTSREVILSRPIEEKPDVSLDQAVSTPQVEKEKIVSVSKVIENNELNYSTTKKIQKIYGPPGTGKTTTLIKLVNSYVGRGVSPNEIGFFAFTNYATKVAKERIIQEFPNLDVEQNFKGFRTLHSLAYQTLPNDISILSREQALHFDKDFKIEAVMMEEDDPSSTVFRAKQPVVDAAAVARSRLISFEEHLNKLSRADLYHLNRWLGYPPKEREQPIKKEDFEKLFSYNNAYEKYKTDLGVIDYTSILEMALNPKNLISEYQIVFIDEAQDLSKLQWKLAERLFKEAKVIYLAGDDDQAICESFGASPETFVSYSVAKETVLEQSYRVPQSNHQNIFNDGTVSALDRKYLRKKKAWVPNSKTTGWYGAIGWTDLFQLIKANQQKDWLIMSATHNTLQGISDNLATSGINHLLSNRLISDADTDVLPSIKLSTIWGAKGGEADITALIRGPYVDEKMLDDDPRLQYVAKTRSKSVHFNVFRKLKSDFTTVVSIIDGMQNYSRLRNRHEDSQSTKPKETNADELKQHSTDTDNPTQSDNVSIVDEIKTINKPPNQKQKYVSNAAKLLDVNIVKRGRRDCVEIILDDGSRRARMWDVERAFSVCKKLIGLRVVTDVANPQKNDQYKWFNNIYLEDD